MKGGGGDYQNRRPILKGAGLQDLARQQRGGGEKRFSHFERTGCGCVDRGSQQVLR